MFYRFAAFSVVAAIATTLGLAGPAWAQTVPHKERASGVLTSIVPITEDNPVGSMEFAAEGNASHVGRYSQVGGHDFFADGTLVGTFTTTAADGSVISGIYYGTFAPIGGTLFQFNVTAEWLEGTGRLTGVTGVAEVVAILDAATGEVHYDTLGTWTLP